MSDSSTSKSPQTHTASHSTAAIILAAGKGTRMKSDLPKVLHPLANTPMVAHVMSAAKKAGCHPVVVVTSPGQDDVRAVITQTDKTALHATQTEQLGTGHAVQSAHEVLAGHQGHVLVLFGDSPLMLPETFERMQRVLASDANVGVVVLGFSANPTPPYGRLITNDAGDLERIVEAKDATAEELAIERVNSGVMAIRGTIVWELLGDLSNDNAQGEYYLTDVIAGARDQGYVCKIVDGSADEVMGVNSRNDLAAAEAIMQSRLRAKVMEDGVTLQDPESVYLSADTELGRDVVVQPNVYFGPNVVVGDKVEIRAFSHLEGTVIGHSAMVGPFARLRPGTNIGEDCRIGNFVEIKKANVESGAKISHLSYIGDAHVGADANIGAGTITCNYDGFRKYHTEIGRDSFIGSNTALVAPVVIGKGAIVAAGSVVTEDVQGDALAVARSRQSQKTDWARDFRTKMEDEAS
ncbi:MAG: bifunctional UDP-N-acetylglucosamine diphosphorylase/glucosamine-1-phosphate N-acetyltransferase GlmU [Rickettsiales bacterium]|nr:bifunctional UDP-N-acetylglucosamine diphosphorylase/glucosamine-1-phosphate N-acetyltransferase GlmU [Rickettsiales bacterium]